MGQVTKILIPYPSEELREMFERVHEKKESLTLEEQEIILASIMFETDLTKKLVEALKEIGAKYREAEWRALTCPHIEVLELYAGAQRKND